VVKDSECDLAKTAAENRVYDFSYKVKKTNIISVNTSDCDCKLGPDKRWGCRATATIVYWKPPVGASEEEIKKSILTKYTKHIIPRKEKILASLLKINKMNKTGAVLKGTRLLKHVQSFQQMLNRIDKAQQMLDSYQTKGKDAFTKETDKLINQLDRDYRSMQYHSNSFSKLAQQIVAGDNTAIKELERQKSNSFKSLECIELSGQGGATSMSNQCGYSVWVIYCAKTGKKKCGDSSKYYTHSRKLAPSETFNNRYSLPPGVEIKYGSCYEKSPIKRNKDGSYSCRNPH
jgi:hypothetical protein